MDWIFLITGITGGAVILFLALNPKRTLHGNLRASNNTMQPDPEVFDLLCRKVKEQVGLDAAEDPLLRERLIAESNRVRKELYTNRSAKVSLPFLKVLPQGPVHFECKISLP